MTNRLYIVHTPYQLMCVINILSKKEEANNRILLVQSKLRQYLPICKTLENTETFLAEELFTDFRSDGKLVAHIKMVYEIIKKKKLLKDAECLKGSFQELFVPSDDIACRVVYSFLISKNQIKLHLFDDGLGTYDAHTFKGISIAGTFVYNTLLGGDFVTAISSVYCYVPSLMASLPQGICLKEVPRNPRTLNLFSEFAKRETSAYLNKRIIFFDQGNSSLPLVNTCLDIIRTQFSKEDTIVKIHPRVQGSVYPDFVCSNDGLPFESIIPSIDLNRCVLISSSSGACFTAYLMTEYRPVVILLAKILNNDENIPAIQFLERMKSSIPDNRIYLPESVEQFEDLLVSLKTQFS